MRNPPPLRPSQSLAISQMQEPTRMGYAIGLPVGSGKTRIVAEFFLKMKAAGRLDHLVVICKKNARQQWIEEVAQVDAGLGFSVTVTNIEQIRNPRGVGYNAIKDVLNFKRCALVIDESQGISYSDTQQTKSAIALGRLAFYRVIMSGTMSDKPEGIYPQFEFLSGNGRNLLGFESFYQFRSFYCRTGKMTIKRKVIKNGKEVDVERTFEKVTGYQNLDNLKEKIAAHGIIRTREDVMPDLPPVQYVFRHVELGKRATMAYKEMNTLMEASLTDYFGDVVGEAAKATIVLTKLLRLQQIASGFLPIKGSDGGAVEYHDFEQDKVDEIMEILMECGEKAKVIIFCKFVYEIHAIEKRMIKEGIKAVSIYGGTIDPDASKRAFQEGDARVCVVGIAAGGTSLNLQKAAAVIFMSLPFSSLDFSQCVGRGDRLGRTGSLIVFQLITKVDGIKETIDEKIMGALDKKIALREYILGGKNGR